MKKISAILITLLLSTNLVFAHGGGHAPIDGKGAIKVSGEGLKILISKGIKIEGKKLDNSWLKIPETNKTISKKGEGYYIVKLKNNTKAKSLYALISADGEFYDANYSGKFEGTE